MDAHTPPPTTRAVGEAVAGLDRGSLRQGGGKRSGKREGALLILTGMVWLPWSAWIAA